MLRLARLLLVGSAAASLGVAVFILSRASGVSPYLAFFVLAAASFIASARLLATDLRRGRLFAWAGGVALAGIGTLAGFGAGTLSFPAAALGLAAAWATLFIGPGRRLAVAGCVVYLLAGMALLALTARASFGFIFLLPGLLVWPLMLSTFAGLPVAIFVAFGAAISLAFAALAPDAPPGRPRRARWPLAATVALLAALAVLAFEIATAYAQPNTSARFELEPIALGVLAVAAAFAGGGLVLTLARVRGALVATTLGSAVLCFALLSRPTVECTRSGVATSGGPWWLLSSGATSASGGGSSPSAGASSGFSGAIRRGDGVAITYRCAGDQLVEFEIRR